MKVHVYLLCHNEEDIISSVLDYYSTFCSKIFVFDNESTDRSVKIAESYKKVQVVPFVTGGKKDNKLHVKIKTQAYKDYSREGGRYATEVADWVICCDMDELIYHPKILDVLDDYKRSGITVPQITGFNMVGENDLVTGTPILKQYKWGVRSPVFDKRAIFDVDFDMAYTEGCHSWGAGFDYMKSLYGYRTSNRHKIALLHYKHIGSRLYEASLRNLERFSAENIIANDDGTYSGPGSHYKFYVDKKFEVSPFIKQAQPVLDDGGNVLFEDFPPTTGETPYNQQGNSVVSRKDMDIIEGFAVSLEVRDRDSIRDFLKVLLKYRPNSILLKNKFDRLASLSKIE